MDDLLQINYIPYKSKSETLFYFAGAGLIVVPILALLGHEMYQNALTIGTLMYYSAVKISYL